MVSRIGTKAPAQHFACHAEAAAAHGDLWKRSLLHGAANLYGQNPGLQLHLLQRNYSQLFLAKRVARESDTKIPQVAPPRFWAK